MKMTNEERQALIECIDGYFSLRRQYNVVIGDDKKDQIYSIALATLTAEPVAWEVKGILCHTKEEADKYVGTPVPLIESLIDNTAQQYEALAGWKVVPIEPTEEMVAAWRKDMNQSYAREFSEKIGEDEVVFGYQAMLEAAPKPEA
ncbi:hypothetical protein [Mixta calida]|uniref:hypothetical protein n=1 Tax=Mixta calida TaxID=665913 RepID=UPI002FDEF5C5